MMVAFLSHSFGVQSCSWVTNVWSFAYFPCVCVVSFLIVFLNENQVIIQATGTTGTKLVKFLLGSLSVVILDCVSNSAFSFIPFISNKLLTFLEVMRFFQNAAHFCSQENYLLALSVC